MPAVRGHVHGRHAASSPRDTARLDGSRQCRCCQAQGQSPRRLHLRERTRSQGPSLPRSYPASSVLCPCPTPAAAAALMAASRPLPSPRRVSPVARITFPTCRAHYPGGPNRCTCRSLPCPRGLPRYAGGSASATSLSRPAQASLTLRPAGLLNRPRRPLSRGFGLASYPTKPLVSYQTYRLLSGWILPPLVIRAFAGHTA